MRRLCTAAESGLTNSALRWGCRAGRWVRVQQSVYAEGPESPTAMDRARAKVLAAGTPARGALAGVLLGLDSVELDDRPTRRDTPPHCLTSVVPTESLMETLMVQLARPIPLLGELTRQHEVRAPSGLFVARIDLSALDIGLFLELDASSTPTSPSTTLVARRRSSPRPAWSRPGSPGTR